MPTSAPSSGPEWVAWLIYLAAGLGAFVSVVQGWRAAKKPQGATAAIVAGDIMSTKPMADLALNVERQNARIEQNAAAMDRAAAALDRACATVDRLIDSNRHLEDTLRDTRDEIARQR